MMNDILRGMLAALFLAAAVAKLILRADIDDLVLAIFFLAALMISEALKDLDNIRSALARMQVENSKHELIQRRLWKPSAGNWMKSQIKNTCRN